MSDIFTNFRPLGIPLGEIATYFDPAICTPSIEGNALVLDVPGQKINIEAVSARNPHTQEGTIRAIVKVTADPPSFFHVPPGKEKTLIAVGNRLAALGGLFLDGGKLRYGSRLTIYEEEALAWKTLHVHLLANSALIGTTGLFSGLIDSLSEDVPATGDSFWGPAEIQMVTGLLSRMSFCNGGDSGLSAEFPLEPGAVSMMAGHRTALFTMETNTPHPSLAGGLFTMLKMPYVTSSEQMEDVCVELNEKEMSTEDGVPHFGAWFSESVGGSDSDRSSPSYVSFIPNALHAVPGIAANVAVWSFMRSQWAKGALESMGIG